jgi:hypothetical protein
MSDDQGTAGRPVVPFYVLMNKFNGNGSWGQVRGDRFVGTGPVEKLCEKALWLVQPAVR